MTKVMKKEYTMPRMEVIDMKVGQQMLAGSIPSGIDDNDATEPAKAPDLFGDKDIEDW